MTEEVKQARLSRMSGPSAARYFVASRSSVLSLCFARYSMRSFPSSVPSRMKRSNSWNTFSTMMIADGKSAAVESFRLAISSNSTLNAGASSKLRQAARSDVE